MGFYFEESWNICKRSIEFLNGKMLAISMGLVEVWLGIPISEALAVIVTLFFLVRDFER